LVARDDLAPMELPDDLSVLSCLVFEGHRIVSSLSVRPGTSCGTIATMSSRAAARNHSIASRPFALGRYSPASHDRKVSSSTP
jgi:hypothetical protein